jgi:hypothetical protein
MAVASRMGTVVRLRAVLAALLLTACLPAHAGVHVVVVSGLGGDAQYAARFASQAAAVAQASVSVTGDAQRVHQLSGEAATSAAVEQRLNALAGVLHSGDQLIVVLIGHASFDGTDYRYNLPGPDLTGVRLAKLLDGFAPGVSQLVVVATSASGALTKPLQHSGRVVITATKSGAERNATRYGAQWVRALTTDEADRDKDSTVTAQEAHDYAERQVADSFKTDAALATEHAVLQGEGAARFAVALLGAKALYAADSQLQTLRGEQQQVESRLDAARSRKTGMSDDAWYATLEPLLVEIAKLDQRIDAREAQLAAAGGKR